MPRGFESDNPSDQDIEKLLEQQNKKTGFFKGSMDDNTISIRLNNGSVTDTALRYLSQFPHLRELFVFCEPTEPDLEISAQGLKALSESKSITWLSLVGIQIDPEGAKAIGRMTHLENLTLTRCGLTDDHTQHFSPLNKLTYLNLNHNEIGNDSINVLSSFVHLETLHLGGTQIGDTNRLESSLPKCTVGYVG